MKTIPQKLRAILGLLLVSVLLASCGEDATIIASWRVDISQACYVIQITGLPAGVTDNFTVQTAGSGGSRSPNKTFSGGNGYYQFCVAIPGDAAETSPLSVSISDSYGGHTQFLTSGTVGSITNTTQPTITVSPITQVP